MIKKVIKNYNHCELINSYYVPSKIKSYIIDAPETINITDNVNINNKILILIYFLTKIFQIKL